MSFQGKVVIVTGASSGIGAATAIKFAEEGAKVCIVGRNQDKLNNVAKKCGNPLMLIADVSKDDDAKRIITETVDKFGQLDILVNNAGIGNQASIMEENTMEVFDKVMNTNLRAAVYLTHLAVPHLVKTKGNIVNVSSIAAVQVIYKRCFSYCTSKAGLDHFTRSVALELASSGVRVNTVNPGPVKTDIIQNAVNDESERKALIDYYNNVTALGRISEPEEVADLILFIASDKAVAITGSSFFTDNGALIKTSF